MSIPDNVSGNRIYTAFSVQTYGGEYECYNSTLA